MKTKKCSGCNKELTIDNFTKNKNNKDGLSYYCKTCSQKNYNLHKYKESGQEEYEQVVIDELKKHKIPLKGLDKDKINNLSINMADLPGIIHPLLKDLPNFCKKYKISYEEYKAIMQACNDNRFYIYPKQ